MFTITPEDFPPKHKRWIHPGANSLRTDDIEGAQPYLPGYKYRNKPNFHNVNDIEKASPKPRFRSLNREEYNLKTSDIPSASPNSVLFKTTRTGNNPLTPVYNLPSYEVKPTTPPRFIRDSMSNNDIDGSKPQIYSKLQVRDSNNVKDILGACHVPRKELNKPDLMNPKDINTIEMFESKRKTNPLMPQYLGRDEENNLVTIGHVDGSSPRKFVNHSQSPHSRHLNTKDIDGATSGTVGVGPIGTKLRNYIKSPTDTQDIEGAQSGTFKKGITTIRATNPLDPQYTWMTEEPSTDVKATPAITNDKFYIKNSAKFWGATPSVSEVSSVKSSEPATPAINNEYARNAKKFYGYEISTPGTLQGEFNRNAEKFFAGNGKVQQMPYIGPGSIHKVKPQQRLVDVETQSYQKNAKEFFYAYTPSSPRSSVGSADTDLRWAANKFYGATPMTGTKERSEKTVNSQEYKFSLSRADIAKPGSLANDESFRESNTNSSINGGSQRKSLSAVGRQFISS